MDGAVFLSAGVPDPKRGPEYAKTADTVAIASAVSALVYVTLGRRQLIWGGQPAITPMIWTIAADMKIDYGSWVRLYQSRHFQDEFPEENKHFQNVTYTDDVDKDLKKSLQEMRRKMFTENEFTNAVFIGGMGGILDEFEMLRQAQPKINLIPLVSAGGAASLVAERMGGVSDDLKTNLDFVALFHRHLGISEREERFRTPQEQPADVNKRFWSKGGRPANPGSA
ncbi:MULTISPECIES: hypothetical protein [unclassified Rhizobium]|uniref:SLOG domain-containing protein n=1 Tax=unclassified Rhizobium TaxID=2613769 RepID=UPI001A995A99|nr:MULTISPECIES: hypothetical protein [unclassified Rhizobium]MBX5164525.1 hypothetical protein [Rhizobium sp. NZLR4b]MBX5190841.1 hypothetical protein [Rhizobium sp. NZLR3b]MBX5204456.1 hypothetical protein [Rhizobium sp. NZLR1]QSZ24676.1 hypothetical protein J3O30_30475 [Rhizobium sp. NZLR1]